MYTQTGNLKLREPYLLTQQALITITGTASSKTLENNAQTLLPNKPQHLTLNLQSSHSPLGNNKRSQ